ncbi:hypothetical protein NP233_g6168 [Leucocoprinus birnbaumii]|uniref:Uncharacterized protein n=1 Tax=Leucocoprinus birnbaumii TaxID=56174 RepID=A0AAD5YVS7_9AGAR|nr:hypothetical protein NP233_g6168 [Leucocoprinus birnbaumii]
MRLSFSASSIAFSIITLVLPLISCVTALCLPCQAQFRRPDFSDQWKLRPRDSNTETIRILNPSYRTVWLNGELQLVTWNTTEVDPRTGDSECQVYLGQWDWNTKDFRKVFFDYPLATNCSIHNGNTTVRVPKEEPFRPANNWVVVLFNRNSEDHSAPFTIAVPP